MIKDHHPVVKAERQIGESTVVGRGVGQMLDVTDGIVASHAHGAADEAWQTPAVSDFMLVDPLFEGG